jgi:hypothetical protein
MPASYAVIAVRDPRVIRARVGEWYTEKVRWFISCAREQNAAMALALRRQDALHVR